MNVSNIFNNSFNDLSNLQNNAYNNIKNYIYVFDFDLTLTTRSTDNYEINNYTNYYELFDSKEKIERLELLLNKIKMNNNIYINTRALIKHVRFILSKVNINLNLITDIKGSEYDEQIHNPFTIHELEHYKLSEIDNIKLLWAIKKVTYLNQIAEEENVDKDNILFFDDSIININAAKLNGYINSFLIGSNDSGLIGLDYLLIKLEQINDILII